MLVMLALLSAFPPLSTDLYLPALPHMVEVMHTRQSLANLTLSLFFLFFSFGVLTWGPVSDKYGRKPVLLIGLGLYTLASLGCAMSANVLELILARIFQAFGGGAATAVATAMVKDMYAGRKRESVLAVVMAMVIIAPVVAPVLGAMILKMTCWRTIFLILGGISTMVFLLSLLLDETLENRYSGSMIHSLGRLGVVMKNPGFSFLLGIFSMVPLPLMAFIAASSFIYIRGFGMNEALFSYYFAFNAVGAMAGPLLYIRISKWMDSGNIIVICFGIVSVCGILLDGAGSHSPTIFALTMVVSTMAMTLMRPPSANLLLSQQETDTGSAASLINFTGMLMGSAGMFLISLNTQDTVSWLGRMQIVVGTVCGSLWLLVRNRTFIRQIE